MEMKSLFRFFRRSKAPEELREREWDRRALKRTAYTCGHVNKINRGHLNEAGNRIVMVSRCYRPKWHDGDHAFVYESVLADD